MVCIGQAAERDITLQWDESIDAPYLQSYKIYYSTTSGPPYAPASDYAQSYSLDGGVNWIPVDQNAPYPITIDKSLTQITLKFLDDRKIYYFAVTAVDSRGLESDFSNEAATTDPSPKITAIILLLLLGD